MISALLAFARSRIGVGIILALVAAMGAWWLFRSGREAGYAACEARYQAEVREALEDQRKVRELVNQLPPSEIRNRLRELGQ